MKGAPSRGHQGLARIRRAAATDAPAIADLHGRSFRATYPNLLKTMKATENGASQRVELWTHRLDDSLEDRAVFLAEDRGEILGFAYVGPTTDTDDSPERTGQIFSIHVDPPVWSAGIGTKLLEFALGHLRSTGVEDATLWVVDDNRRARTFYESLGWKQDGAERTEILAIATGDGDEVDVIRYRRQLRGEEDR
jgi:ribosomal protein S18 acetylase RimI-like enzyme